jgi:hypothetical protein
MTDLSALLNTAVGDAYRIEDRFERSNATNDDVLPDGRGFVMLEPLVGTQRVSVMVNWGPERRRLLGGDGQ